jgi:methionyl aminopeptidase
MTTYPDIRPVPKHIPRPAYVPANFFDAGWGDHDEVAEVPVPSQEEGRLDQGGMQGVRTAGRLAAEILREAGKLVKVSIVRL